MEKIEAEIPSEYYAAAMRDWIATELPELDAACILIQLSGDSRANTATSSCGRDESADTEDKSVGDTTGGGAAAAHDRNIDCDRLSASSNVDIVEGCGEIGVSRRRRKRRFRSISELYAKTKPLVAVKKSRFL